MFATVLFENVPVARINVGARTGDTALDYAYFRTQNIQGSWSRGESFDFGGETYINQDFSEDIEVLAELPVSERTGETMGLRSSMVFDTIEFGGETFQVDFAGFKKV